ncbi:MAG: glycosyltransferase [Aestuariivirga sp.]
MWRTLRASLAEIPASLDKFAQTHELVHIHNNHYFNLPMADRIKQRYGTMKVVSETHDIQSEHMFASAYRLWAVGENSSYEAYLRDEFHYSNLADELVHLNAAEFDTFKVALPHKKHHLIYPGLHRPPKSPDTMRDIDFLIVASDNEANYNSLRWFLDNVWDESLHKRATLRIVGNIDRSLKGIGRQRYSQYKDLFAGRVNDLHSWYCRAKTVLVPVIQGHGIAVKTIEALSYGLPMIFSPLAIRGFDGNPAVSKLHAPCTTAAEFKSAIEARIVEMQVRPDQHPDTAETSVYEQLFTFEKYRKNISLLLKAPE